jgi:hypothetical protein
VQVEFFVVLLTFIGVTVGSGSAISVTCLKKSFSWPLVVFLNSLATTKRQEIQLIKQSISQLNKKK